MTYAHTLESWRDAQEMERYSIIDCAEERREIQAEKRLNDSILDAYERTDMDAINCDMED